jgi:hypothetical protein
LASQFIYLHAHLLSVLQENYEPLTAALARRDVELLDRSDEGQGLLVLAANRAYELGARRMSCRVQFALCLVPEREIPARWPRPLPDQTVLRLLDIFESAITELPRLTSHDVIEIGEALNASRDAAAIGVRKVEPLCAVTPRQKRLLGLGRCLAGEFGPELVLLDSKLASYRALGGDLEGSIARLSCHAELGSRLRVDPGDPGIGPTASLKGPSRRGDICESIDIATALGDATIRLLQRHDPYDAAYRPIRDSNDIISINWRGTGVTWQRAKARKLTTRKHVISVETHPIRGTITPGQLMPELEGWISDFHERRWTGVHPLIRVAIGHIEFVRMLPFPRGNGRTARLLSAIHLREADWPALPLEAAFEHVHEDYQEAIRATLRSGSYRPMLRLMLSACELAIELGQRMNAVLDIEHESLFRRLLAHPLPDDVARQTADHLLSGVLVECPDLDPEAEKAVLRLVREGAVEKISTPLGDLYSVSAVQRLLADLPSTDSLHSRHGDRLALGQHPAVTRRCPQIAGNPTPPPANP